MSRIGNIESVDMVEINKWIRAYLDHMLTPHIKVFKDGKLYGVYKRRVRC